MNAVSRLFAIVIVSNLLVACGIGGFWMEGNPFPTPIKPYLRHLEKPGVTDEQRREDCRTCGGGCPVRYPPHVVFPLKKPPEICWSNPKHPELCTDILDAAPGFPKEAWEAATLPSENPDESSQDNPSKANRDYNAIRVRLIQKWKECMFNKGYIWNSSNE